MIAPMLSSRCLVCVVRYSHAVLSFSCFACINIACTTSASGGVRRDATGIHSSPYLLPMRSSSWVYLWTMMFTIYWTRSVTANGPALCCNTRNFILCLDKSNESALSDTTLVGSWLNKTSIKAKDGYHWYGCGHCC